jgi:GAF domain-containing protein
LERGHYWAEHLSCADTERGQIPVARAIRSGTTQVCHDVFIDPAFNPWREAIQARGYHAKIALPLHDDGKTFGGLSIYSSDANTFYEKEFPLLEELASGLAYGIVTLRARKANAEYP